LLSHINTHFAAKLHKLRKKEQQRVAEEVKTINELISNKETLRRSEFTFPLPTAKPIATLGRLEENSLQCI
jgi:hypothetical protein